MKVFIEGPMGETDWMNQRILSVVPGVCERHVIITDMSSLHSHKIWHSITA